jgi:hypothetical protein
MSPNPQTIDTIVLAAPHPQQNFVSMSWILAILIAKY